jgi:hypothetical protein
MPMDMMGGDMMGMGPEMGMGGDAGSDPFAKIMQAMEGDDPDKEIKLTVAELGAVLEVAMAAGASQGGMEPGMEPGMEQGLPPDMGMGMDPMAGGGMPGGGMPGGGMGGMPGGDPLAGMF